MRFSISGLFATGSALLSTNKNTVICVAVTALSLALSATSAADTFYKWKNESGVWSYGEHPPQGVEAIAVNTTSGADSPPDTGGPEQAADSEEAAGNQSDGTPEYFVTQADTVSKEEKERLCKAARANLETLESSAVIRKRDANGEISLITDEERQAEIENARQTIKDFC